MLTDEQFVQIHRYFQPFQKVVLNVAILVTIVIATCSAVFVWAFTLGFQTSGANQICGEVAFVIGMAIGGMLVTSVTALGFTFRENTTANRRRIALMLRYHDELAALKGEPGSRVSGSPTIVQP